MVRALGLLPLLAFAGCGFDSMDPPERLEWLAEVESSLHDQMLGFNGTVSMVTDLGITEIGVELEDATEDAQFAWRIRIGTCDEPGELITGEAAFEDFAIDENGEGGIPYVPMVGQIRGDLEYVAQIYDAGQEDGDLLECQPMERIDAAN